MLTKFIDPAEPGQAALDNAANVRRREVLRLTALFVEHRRTEEAAERRKLRSKGRLGVEELPPELDNLVNAPTRPHRCYRAPVTSYFKNHQASTPFLFIDHFHFDISTHSLFTPQNQTILNATRTLRVVVHDAASQTLCCVVPARYAHPTFSSPFHPPLLLSSKHNHAVPGKS